MTGRIHVVHLITRLDRGGSAQNTLLTAMSQCEQYQVTLVHGHADITSLVEAEALRQDLDMARKAGLRLIEIPALRRNVGPLQDLEALFAAWCLFRRERPIIVHTHTSKGGAIGRVAAWLAKVPILMHTPHGHVFYGYFTAWVSRTIALVECWLASLTDRLVMLTDREMEEHLAVGVGQPGQFRVVPSGVPVERFRSCALDMDEARRRFSLPVKGELVMFVGRLVPIKGLTTLIEATPRILAAHPDAAVVLVGAGPLEDELVEQVVGLGIRERVIFVGYQADVPECLTAADIFVLPSLNEGMGRALVEAMMMGKPIVASRVGGVPTLIRHGENGLLVPPNDPGALAQAVISLLDDPALQCRLGDAARTIVEQGYDTATMMKRIETIYDELLAEKGLA